MARNSIIGWIVKKLKGNMALVEDTETASQNISANKYVVFQGVLCTADAAISQGDTLATSGAGKNLTEVTGGGFNELNDHIANIEIFSNSANQTYGKWIDGSTVYRLAKQWTNVSISANTDVAFASITELYGKSVVDMNVTLKHSGGVISNNRNVETWLTDGTNVKVLNIRQGHASVGTWDVYAVFYYL